MTNNLRVRFEDTCDKPLPMSLTCTCSIGLHRDEAWPQDFWLIPTLLYAYSVTESGHYINVNISVTSHWTIYFMLS